MARKSDHRTMRKHKSRAAAPWLWIVFSFLVGYGLGSWYNLLTLQRWCALQWSTYYVPHTPVKTVAQHAVIPKPEFEFYTLLAKDSRTPVTNTTVAASKVPASKPVLAQTEPTPKTAPEPRVAHVSETKPSVSEQYVVQIASFQQLREAERLRVALLMKGFDAHISTISQNHTHWFRVSLGPFTTKPEAQLAQSGFARRQHIMGMIRRMDA